MDVARRAPVAEAALVGIAAVWGLTFVMVQDAVERMPVMTFLAYRFLSATALVATVFAPKVRALSRDGWRAGLLMGVFLTGGYVFQTLGLERTSAANAGFITGLFVVLTPIFGAVFLGQRTGATVWLAAAVSTLGLYLVSGPGGEGDVAGDLLVVITACSFAWHILATDRAVRGHDTGALLVVQLGVCGAFSFFVALFAGDLVLPRSAPVWNALIVTTLVASALGFFVQTYAQRHASPARTALILASEPAFAGLFAYVLADETFSALGWAGALLIVGAIFAVEAVPYVRPPRPLPEG